MALTYEIEVMQKSWMIIDKQFSCSINRQNPPIKSMWKRVQQRERNANQLTIDWHKVNDRAIRVKVSELPESRECKQEQLSFHRSSFETLFFSPLYAQKELPTNSSTMNRTSKFETEYQIISLVAHQYQFWAEEMRVSRHRWIFANFSFTWHDNEDRFYLTCDNNQSRKYAG